MEALVSQVGDNRGSDIKITMLSYSRQGLSTSTRLFLQGCRPRKICSGCKHTVASCKSPMYHVWLLMKKVPYLQVATNRTVSKC